LFWNIVLEVRLIRIKSKAQILIVLRFYDWEEKLSYSHSLKFFDWLGSLDKLLYDSNVKLSDDYKMRLVHGIAAGMLHLHKHNIVHRDLAARNVLLTSEGHPKISVLFCFVSFHFFQFLCLCHSHWICENKLKLIIETNSFCWIDCV
jgi:serine/threonine protein kinase